jgi:hypothetical protein
MLTFSADHGVLLFTVTFDAVVLFVPNFPTRVETVLDEFAKL